MTCLNCPIEITSMHLYLEGVHVSVLFRDKVRNYYFLWQRAGETDFFTMLRLITRIAQVTVTVDGMMRAPKE